MTYIKIVEVKEEGNLNTVLLLLKLYNAETLLLQSTLPKMNSYLIAYVKSLYKVYFLCFLLFFYPHKLKFV